MGASASAQRGWRLQEGGIRQEGVVASQERTFLTIRILNAEWAQRSTGTTTAVSLVWGANFFRPWLPCDDWVRPDVEPQPPTFGRMGPRSTGCEDCLGEQVAMQRQVSFSDDCFSSSDEEEIIVNHLKNKHIARTKDIQAALAMPKKRVNQHLYALAEMGIVMKILNSPPTWEYNGETEWEKMLKEHDATEKKLTNVDLDEGKPGSRPMRTRFSDMVRKNRVVDDPSEVSRGEFRDSPDNVLVGFSPHPAEAIKGEHELGDTSYLGEMMCFDVRGGKATLDYTHAMDKAGTREARKAQEDERKMMLEHGDILGLDDKEARAWNGTWEPVPENGNLPGVHIARPTVGNAVKAMKDRHFKLDAKVGKMTELGRKHVQRASGILKTYLMQTAFESGKLEGVFESQTTCHNFGR